MGVITETDIDYGSIFGPFPAVGHIPQAHFIGLLTTDERSDSRNIKINLNDRSLGNSWLPYVHPARTVTEQNVEAYTKDGLIYYRTLQILRADEELLVWYSKDFGQILDIPDIRPPQDQDDNVLFTCEYCGKKFRFIFPLTAHLRFKCTRNKSLLADASSDDTEKTNPDDSHETGKSKTRHLVLSDNRQNLKRCAESDGNDASPKRLAVEPAEENNNNTDAVSKVSPLSTSRAGEGFSAFRKVEKSHVEDVATSRVGQSSTSYSVRDVKHVSDTMDMYKSVIRSNSYNDSLTTGLGMMMPGWFVHQSTGGHPFIDPRVYAERLQTSSADKINVMNRISGINSNVTRSFPTSGLINRQNMMLMEQLRKTQLPAISAANPMVEKILTPAPSLMQRPLQQLNLAQNWCAKCNATFRMTSDLVYHMRSHHKREFDPMKRKREDKLQCSVCKETFKERHHLTRHMTSHA